MMIRMLTASLLALLLIIALREVFPGSTRSASNQRDGVCWPAA